MNLQPLPKLSTNDDSIRKYIDDNEDAFNNMQTNVTDLEIQYKQMDQEITNASSKEDAFSIQPSGTISNKLTITIDVKKAFGDLKINYTLIFRELRRN